MKSKRSATFRPKVFIVKAIERSSLSTRIIICIRLCHACLPRRATRSFVGNHLRRARRLAMEGGYYTVEAESEYRAIAPQHTSPLAVTGASAKESLTARRPGSAFDAVAAARQRQHGPSGFFR